MSTDTDAHATFEAIAAEFVATSPTTRSNMFRMPCLKNSNGKTFAGFRRGTMIFKLAPPQRVIALALPGADLFDPSEQGRPWKEWVQVPAEHASHWRELTQAAYHYVDTTLESSHRASMSW